MLALARDTFGLPGTFHLILPLYKSYYFKIHKSAGRQINSPERAVAWLDGLDKAFNPFYPLIRKSATEVAEVQGMKKTRAIATPLQDEYGNRLRLS
jgi:hypothetical protein